MLDKVLGAKIREYAPAYELALVNLIRQRLKEWKGQGFPGVTRTSLELLQWWRRDGRDKRLHGARTADRYQRLGSQIAHPFVPGAKDDGGPLWRLEYLPSLALGRKPLWSPRTPLLLSAPG
jgi:hypothetical protein